jgi:DNA-binding LacI/PurR family transcriptional regulator
MTFGVERPLLKSLASYGIPLVFVDASPRQALASTIKIDYRLGIRQALEHLSRLGHKDVAFISGPSKYFSAVCRKEAFLEGLKSVGLRLHPAYLREGDHRLEGGQHEMQHLMRLKKPPTAVMCSNDVTALGAMHAAGILRLSVPVDVSIIGFDDIDFTRYSMPPLSSIQMSRKHLARAALMSLVALAEGGTEFTPAVVQTQFVPRESTAPPREKSSESRLSAS